MKIHINSLNIRELSHGVFHVWSKCGDPGLIGDVLWSAQAPNGLMGVLS